MQMVQMQILFNDIAQLASTTHMSKYGILVISRTLRPLRSRIQDLQLTKMRDKLRYPTGNVNASKAIFVLESLQG